MRNFKKGTHSERYIEPYRQSCRFYSPSFACDREKAHEGKEGFFFILGGVRF